MSTSTPEGFPPTTGCDERQAMLLKWANKPEEAISLGPESEQAHVVVRGLGIALTFFGPGLHFGPGQMPTPQEPGRDV